MKNIISLTGDIASGKGVTSCILSKKLDYTIYKASTAIRELCIKKGITINEFQEYVSKHPEFDIKIEEEMGQYANENDNYIIEARTGWFTAPFSFKVYLTVDIDVAAMRIFNDTLRSDEDKYNSIEEAKQAIILRSEEEANRWLRLYNKDIKNKENFDLVIDTTDKTAEQVADIIIEKYNIKRKQEGLLV